MDQGKGSWDPSILSVSVPQLSLCIIVWAEQEKGIYTSHSHRLVTALAAGSWGQNEECCTSLEDSLSLKALGTESPVLLAKHV